MLEKRAKRKKTPSSINISAQGATEGDRERENGKGVLSCNFSNGKLVELLFPRNS